MTVFGDLETSTLRQLPGGRGGVSSSVVPKSEKPAWMDRAWARIREEVAEGRQAYVVCPRIGDEGGSEDEPDDADGAPDDRDAQNGDGPRPLAVLDVAEQLRTGPLAGLRLEVLHGRLGADEKEARMRAFAAGEIDVLVATTVVEVGVDVPNATVMVVMDADRFGVSQLHQLRGRVARGAHPGLCLLVTDAPTDSSTGRRLAAVAATTDGFALARLDLETRREGDALPAPGRGAHRDGAGGGHRSARIRPRPGRPSRAGRRGRRALDRRARGVPGEDMTRLIAGTAGGRRLKVPPSGVRPTGDRAREGLFNSLGTLVDLEGARVLDLYAGSGALGLEALSRGAEQVVFVESSAKVRRVLEENLAAVGVPGGRVVAGSVPSVVAGAPPAAFDVVLADPPYDTPVDEVLGVLRRLVEGGWLAPGAVVVVERSSREEPFEWPTPLEGLRERRYGEAALRYGRHP
jgi:16S rRNA (guanine(966)-N(2))-methyltransferase RsmD